MQANAATFHGCTALEATINEADGMRNRSEGSFQHVSAEGAALEAELGELQHLYDKFKDPVHVSELCVQIRQTRPNAEQVVACGACTSAELLMQVRDAVEASLNEEAACPRHGKRMMESFMEAVSKDLALINQLREQLNDDVSPSLCLPLCVCAARHMQADSG